ncbi:surface protein SdrI, putative [[Synechococcus] sp. NIES-970]|nr:surface protein SdrI, putative [[Synechococcus] sp. NIES-970]
MSLSDEFKQALRSGDLSKAFTMVASKATVLKITTRVVRHLDQGDTDDPSKSLHTELDLINGTVENEIGADLLGTEQYQHLQHFHQQQVSQGNRKIQENVQGLQQLFQLLVTLQQYDRLTNAEAPLDLKFLEIPNQTLATQTVKVIEPFPEPPQTPQGAAAPLPAVAPPANGLELEAWAQSGERRETTDAVVDDQNVYVPTLADFEPDPFADDVTETSGAIANLNELLETPDPEVTPGATDLDAVDDDALFKLLKQDWQNNPAVTKVTSLDEPESEANLLPLPPLPEDWLDQDDQELATEADSGADVALGLDDALGTDAEAVAAALEDLALGDGDVGETDDRQGEFFADDGAVEDTEFAWQEAPGDTFGALSDDELLNLSAEDFDDFLDEDVANGTGAIAPDHEAESDNEFSGALDDDFTDSDLADLSDELEAGSLGMLNTAADEDTDLDLDLSLDEELTLGAEATDPLGDEAEDFSLGFTGDDAVAELDEAVGLDFEDNDALSDFDVDLLSAIDEDPELAFDTSDAMGDLEANFPEADLLGDLGEDEEFTLGGLAEEDDESLMPLATGLDDDNAVADVFDFDLDAIDLTPEPDGAIAEADFVDLGGFSLEALDGAEEDFTGALGNFAELGDPETSLEFDTGEFNDFGQEMVAPLTETGDRFNLEDLDEIALSDLNALPDDLAFNLDPDPETVIQGDMDLFPPGTGAEADLDLKIADLELNLDPSVLPPETIDLWSEDNDSMEDLPALDDVSGHLNGSGAIADLSGLEDDSWLDSLDLSGELDENSGSIPGADDQEGWAALGEAGTNADREGWDELTPDLSVSEGEMPIPLDDFDLDDLTALDSADLDDLDFGDDSLLLLEDEP